MIVSWAWHKTSGISDWGRLEGCFVGWRAKNDIRDDIPVEFIKERISRTATRSSCGHGGSFDIYLGPTLDVASGLGWLLC